MPKVPALAPLRRWDPERVGAYTLQGRLGSGAMGEVYLGRSAAGRLFAVKTIKIEFADEPGFRARFAREVAAARRVSGVFTAAVVEADADADVPWLATAYVPAPSLNRLVQACGPLPVPAAQWLAAGCAEALESIHGAGLVHRDLKPSNVLVAPDGPRVIDFGVARAAERIQLTVTRGAVGTPAYMAPEQARDTRQASSASDVYALGATLLFAVTGHPPYAGDTVMDVLVRLATEQPDLAGLPDELAGIVTACLERSPRGRPTSAALLSELGSFLDATSGPSTRHSHLTDCALALIAKYEHRPGPAAGAVAAGDAGEEATFGSYTALPAPRPGPARRWPLRSLHRAGTPPSRSRSRARRSPAWHRPRRRPRAIAATALASGVVALVAVGALLGASLRGQESRPQPPATRNGFPGPPPGPPSVLPTSASTTPELRMNQPFGDPDTVFVIHGSGFKPLTHVTVELTGHGASRLHPVVDNRGTFNYAIGQGDGIFAGPIPPGVYHVVVTDSGVVLQARAVFKVGSPPSGPGDPPAGQGAPPAGQGAPPSPRLESHGTGGGR